MEKERGYQGTKKGVCNLQTPQASLILAIMMGYASGGRLFRVVSKIRIFSDILKELVDGAIVPGKE